MDGEELRARWALVVPHRDRLLAMARRCCATPQDAEDAVHEAMLRAVAYPGLDPARVGALLTSITTRLAIDMARRRGSERRGRPRLVTLPAQAAPPDEAVLDQDEARWLAAQIARLPEREREVFERRSAGLSVGETASLLRISYKSVESAFTRARNRLRLWAATLGWLVATRLRRSRSRPAMLTVALLASAGCVAVSTLAPHGGSARNAPRSSPHGTIVAVDAASQQKATAPAPVHPGSSGVAAAWTPTRRSSSGGTATTGGNGSPPPIGVHTGPVQGPPGSNTGWQDIGVTVDPSGDPVSSTTDCIANFSLELSHFGCPPS